MPRYMPDEAARAVFQGIVKQIDGMIDAEISYSTLDGNGLSDPVAQSQSVAALEAVREDILRMMTGQATQDEAREFCARMKLRSDQLHRQTEVLHREAAYLRGVCAFNDLGADEDEHVSMH